LAHYLYGFIFEDTLQWLDIPSSQFGLFIRSKRLPIMTSADFISVHFVFDEVSSGLFAILESVLDSQQVSVDSLRSDLQRQGFDNFGVTDQLLEHVLQQVAEGKACKVKLADKPEFTGLRFVFDEVGKTLVAELFRTEIDPKITCSSVQKAITDGNFQKFKLQNQAINDLVSKAVSNERGQFTLGRLIDAEVIVTVADDQMSAQVTITAAEGGERVAPAELKAAVLAEGILPEFCDLSTLKHALRDQPVKDIKFAEALPAERGIDARFFALVDEAVYHDKPTIDDSDIADYRDVKDFTIVDVGEPLMRREQHTQGKDGKNIKGDVIVAEAGEDTPFANEMLGVELDPSDNNLLLAGLRGHPVALKTGMRVDQVIKVIDVNFKTGNVVFDGSLLVAGDIAADMLVDVTGDVIVQGIIHSAKITAGGNITCSGGVVGRDTGGGQSEAQGDKIETATLKAGGDIRAQYISLANLEAGSDIEVAQYIAHCHSDAGKRVLIGQSSGKGCLIGGYCYALNSIEVNSVGSEAAIKTQLNVGIKLEKDSDYEQLKKDHSLLLLKVEKLDAIYKQFVELKEANKLSDEKKKKGEKLKAAIKTLNAEIEVVCCKITGIEAVAEGGADGALVLVTKKTYPNVMFSIEGVDFTVRQEGRGGIFTRCAKEVHWNSDLSSR